MEAFEIKLKEFCFLTIEKIDLHQEKNQLIIKQDYESLANLKVKIVALDLKINSLVKSIESEVNNAEIDSEKAFDFQIRYSFLNQFGSKNMYFNSKIDAKIALLENEIKTKQKNYDFKNTDNLKLEIINLYKAKSTICKNWWNVNLFNNDII